MPIKDAIKSDFARHSAAMASSRIIDTARAHYRQNSWASCGLVLRAGGPLHTIPAYRFIPTRYVPTFFYRLWLHHYLSLGYGFRTIASPWRFRLGHHKYNSLNFVPRSRWLIWYSLMIISQLCRMRVLSLIAYEPFLTFSLFNFTHIYSYFHCSNKFSSLSSDNFDAFVFHQSHRPLQRTKARTL
jgi:hypothetical protein